jgi:hypothetical protein
MRWKEHERSFRLRFDNGLSLEILKHGDIFEGIGNVRLGRRKLRSAELPILPLVATPGAHRVVRLEFEDIARADDAVTISLRPYVVSGGPTEWVCCDGQDRWEVGTWSQSPERDRGGMLQVTFRPVDKVLGGIPFAGFSYAYRFHSRKHHVYRVHDRSTWELGGWATGNSFWLCGPFNEPQAEFRKKDDAFTSALRRPDGGPPLQQFLPLFTALQGFTFQFDRHSLLVTAFERPFHCDSLFQKEHGRNYIVHWHQLCGDLQGCLEFPALQVLCAPVEALHGADRANQYCAVRDELHSQYRQDAGVLRPDTAPSGCLVGAGKDLKRIQRGLDELARGAFTRVCLPGLLGANDPKDHTAKARLAATERVRRVTELARGRALEVAASLTDCCSRWAALDSADDGDSTDVHGSDMIAAALHDGDCWDGLLRHLRRLKNEFHLDAVFADGPMDAIARRYHWAGTPTDGPHPHAGPRITSLAGRRVELVAALQKMGFRCLLTGPMGLDTPGQAPPGEAVLGREFMFRDRVLNFPHKALAAAQGEPADVYFRGCANRLSYMPTYDTRSGARGRMAGWWDAQFATINRAYQAVREYMERSELLPDDAGVLWTGADPDVRILWSYCRSVRDVSPGAEVFDVIDSAPVDVTDGRLVARPRRVYLLQNAG